LQNLERCPARHCIGRNTLEPFGNGRKRNWILVSDVRSHATLRCVSSKQLSEGNLLRFIRIALLFQTAQTTKGGSQEIFTSRFLEGVSNFGFFVFPFKIFGVLKVGTNENGSACGRWQSIGI
jgi:hypothetical protein